MNEQDELEQYNEELMDAANYEEQKHEWEAAQSLASPTGSGCSHIRARDIGESAEGMGRILVEWCPDCGAIKRTMTNWKFTQYGWETPSQNERTES